MLIAFGGLPGVGKTTLAKALANSFGAVYLRIDTIEQALRSSNVLRDDVGPAGYVIAYKLAEENLKMGRMVVADSVNALRITRDCWAQIAREAHVPLLEVEVVCSDPAEHRRRIESRPGTHHQPGLTWEAVTKRTYEPWPTAHLIIDTARKTIQETNEALVQYVGAIGHSPSGPPCPPSPL